MNRCFLCELEEESIDHILLHYNKARFLWCLLFSLFDVSWVIPSSVKETVLSWYKSFVGGKRMKM